MSGILSGVLITTWLTFEGFSLNNRCIWSSEIKFHRPPFHILSLPDNITTEHTASFCLQTETYYEQLHFQEVLKVTNPAENENPAFCQRNEREWSSPSPFTNYHQAQNCEPETRGIL
ncbi:hypothetical protein CEXT_308621 [Caerostris extrusa]|uniref:Uncharacterized protein n=1 Tax=Caerostris extrusa TaxID=172846 RepID=A0AAV4XME3_CAEEX|nr:hypothetical protein CEXT_308621 [Caerostris extrusa]